MKRDKCDIIVKEFLYVCGQHRSFQFRYILGNEVNTGWNIALFSDTANGVIGINVLDIVHMTEHFCCVSVSSLSDA